MPALVAGIHVLPQRADKDVDGRNKPSHDGDRWVAINDGWNQVKACANVQVRVNVGAREPKQNMRQRFHANSPCMNQRGMPSR
jgi:hypothetical protein